MSIAASQMAPSVAQPSPQRSSLPANWGLSPAQPSSLPGKWPFWTSQKGHLTGSDANAARMRRGGSPHKLHEAEARGVGGGGDSHGRRRLTSKTTINAASQVAL
ncbi:hypothetical protein GCM10027427_03960 [Pseudoclavibacter terrae]